MAQERTALAQRIIDLPPEPINDIVRLRDLIKNLQTTANVITPIASMDYIPPMHRISVRQVLIDPTIEEIKKGDYTEFRGTDCYFDPKFCEKGKEVALSKVGIMRLVNAAGIDIEDSYEIVSDIKDPWYCGWRVIALVPQLDGKMQKHVSTKIVDLRTENQSTAKMPAKMLEQQRARIRELAETKALLRLARNALNLRQKYTVAELQKPFVIPVLVPDLDLNDPVIKQMVAAKTLGLAGALFGAPEGGPRMLTPRRPLSLPENVGPGGEVIEVPDDDEDADGEAEASEIEPLPQEAPSPAPVSLEPTRCACPCGCTDEIKRAVFDATKREGGSPRCVNCWPSRRFDYEKHKGLKDLGLNKKLTPEQVRDAHKGA